MAEDAIGKAGLYFDELNKIRVLEPEVAVQTNDLKDASKDFIESELNLDVTTTEIDVMKSLPLQTLPTVMCIRSRFAERRYRITFRCVRTGQW